MVATAGSDDKVNFVEQHGAKGVNYKTQNFADEVRVNQEHRSGGNVLPDRASVRRSRSSRTAKVST